MAVLAYYWEFSIILAKHIIDVIVRGTKSVVVFQAEQEWGVSWQNLEFNGPNWSWYLYCPN